MKRRWLVASSSLALFLMRSVSCSEHAPPTHEALERRAHDNLSGATRSFPAVIQYHAAPRRFLKGDFEAPELLLVVYHRDWEDSVASIVAAAERQARIGLLVKRADMGELAASGLAAFAHVEVLRTTMDSPWIRDYGPLETYDATASRLWLDFDYAGHRPADDRLPRWLSVVYGTELVSHANALDGGAILSNGAGLCAISTRSLTDGGFDARASAELEGFFAELGCDTVAILPEMPGERTGHADMMGQFLSRDHAMVASYDAEKDPRLAQALNEAADRLSMAGELAGVPLKISRVPLAVQDGRFYSYVNSTRLLARMLVPRFEMIDPEAEHAAHQAIAKALPDVELVGVPSDKLIGRGGAVHCATLGLGSVRRKAGPPPRRRRRG